MSTFFELDEAMFQKMPSNIQFSIGQSTRRRNFGGLVIALTLVHLVLSSQLPPAEDELYYWSWSKLWEWSYYDHPPLVAYLIRFSTSIFGDTLFGIRFFAVILSGVSLWMVARICDHYTMVWLVSFTPLFAWGAMIMTPDVPLMFFWTLYYCWLISVCRSLSQWCDDPVIRVYTKEPIGISRWVLGGLFLGLGCLSKYTMYLLIPCTVVLFCLMSSRGWQKGFLIHCLVALVVNLPVFMFNLEYGFIPFKFQWGHAVSSGGGSLSTFLEFITSQMALVGALPFLLLPFLIVNWRRRDPVETVSRSLFALPVAFFLVQSFRTRLEANWALPAWIAFWPLAQRIYDHTSFRLWARIVLGLCFTPPILISLLIAFSLIHPIEWVKPEQDRISRMKVQYEISKQAAVDFKKWADAGTPLVAGTYQWTAYFRFQGVETEQLADSGRKSHFNLIPKDLCSRPRIFLFIEPERMPEELECFSHRKERESYELKVRNQVLSTFKLMELTHAPG